MKMELSPIAVMRSDFPTKFGIPRQSGLVEELRGYVVFEKEYSDPAAFRGIEEFSHLWLIWGFSEAVRSGWSPTVRPPRLGGNTRLGVFATRSPFRPNAIGLSCVRLLGVTEREGRIALEVAGADLMDGTPIYDVKPYIPYADAKPEASAGFTGRVSMDPLKVVLPEELASHLPEDKRSALIGVLQGDPRPHYHSDPERVYGFTFAGFEVRFTVSDGVCTVRSVEPNHDF